MLKFIFFKRLSCMGLGSLGESIASSYIGRLGYKIVKRNYKSRLGEIDIIATDKGTLVFIEVKTRRTDRFGPPVDAVDQKKRARLIRSAMGYINRTKRYGDSIRFDVVSVTIKGRWRKKVTLIKNAFLMGRSMT